MNITTLHLCRGTRFRWIQVTPDSARVAAWQWGIRQVYIGPACSDMCSGQGFCQYPTCHCDKGFYGESCQVSTDHKVCVFKWTVCGAVICEIIAFISMKLSLRDYNKRYYWNIYQNFVNIFFIQVIKMVKYA